MTSGYPRRRASTLKAPKLVVSELQSRLDVLRGPITAEDVEDSHEHGIAWLTAGQHIRQILHDDDGTRHTRDAFRHLDGFQTILFVVEALLRGPHDPSSPAESGLRSESQHSLLPELLQTTLSILSAALRNHAGNQRFFQQRIGGGGWASLGTCIINFFKSHTTVSNLAVKDRTLGSLLACALDDESVTSVVGALRRSSDRSRQTSSDGTESFLLGSATAGDLPISEDQVKSAQMTAALLRKEIPSTMAIQHPDAIIMMLEIWKSTRDHEVPDDELPDRIFSIIYHLAIISTTNLVALHSAGALRVLLPCLLNVQCFSPDTISRLKMLIGSLLHFGIGTLDDAYFLYHHARSRPDVSETLAQSLRASQMPCHIQFDLSLHGYASVELPGIGRAFPPFGTSAGYTLALWLQVVRYDSNVHTTLFGAFDASQTCFVLVYLEKDTRNLILQTSVKSSRPSVRFRSTAFKTGRWYHIVITHARPKSTVSARASLFIDGEFVEQVKAQYPSSTPNPSPDTPRKVSAIQTFLGTPQDLATRLGKNMVLTQWRSASSHLFSDILSDDLIAVYYQLGPRYTGNFQDCLGSFQTYEASAALNLRNESLHPGKEDKSEVVAAIKHKAGSLLPEHIILLNISASVVLDDNDRNNIDENQLARRLSKTAGRNLKSVTRAGGNALAINGAIPSINEALLHSSGFAVLTGDPTVVVPQCLDEAAWRVGGCAAVGLALLEASHSDEGVLRSLDIIFETIKGNWRNSEAMERENGFGVLATILGSKLEGATRIDIEASANQSDVRTSDRPSASLRFRVLGVILNFVGYRSHKTEDSVINNPLAYRMLLVEMALWRSSSPDVQKLYYEQFTIFASRSKFHLFNMKRLQRMRIVKRWLDNLKTDTFTEETFTYCLDAFKVVLGASMSSESMRSLSLYITYAYSKPHQTRTKAIPSHSVRTNVSIAQRRESVSKPMNGSSSHRSYSSRELAPLDVGIRLFSAYTDILCREDETNNVQKFARTVTIKWLLHLLADNEEAIVQLAAKILARLLVLSSREHFSKFVEKSGGITIMQYRFKRWWRSSALWTLCFAILFGVDPAKIDFTKPFSLFSLLETFAAGGQLVVLYPEILSVLTSMLQSGLVHITREQADPESPAAPSNRGSSFNDDANVNGSSPNASPGSKEQLLQSANLLRIIVRFLADLHSRFSTFREFAITSSYVQELFGVLFPVVVSASPVSPAMELNSRNSSLTFHGSDVLMRPLSVNAAQTTPVVRMARPGDSQTLKPSECPALRRMSSYVLIPSEGTLAQNPQNVDLQNASKIPLSLSNSIVEEILELSIAVFADQIFGRKDFAGLGLFMRVPPGFQEHQAYFETFILRNTLSQLRNQIKLDQKMLWEPRVLTNLARLANHLGEAVFEGWFIRGAEDTVNFLAELLEYLMLPDIASLKSVRLCSQIILGMKAILLRVTLLALSELDEIGSPGQTVVFLQKLGSWQHVFQVTDETQSEYTRYIFYLLYKRLTGTDQQITEAACDLWRVLIAKKTDMSSLVLQQLGSAQDENLVLGLQDCEHKDHEEIVEWVATHQEDLETRVFKKVLQGWKNFVATENKRTTEIAQVRITRRRDKLKSWDSENVRKDEALRRHEIGTAHWRFNIYAAEDLKRQRAVQDQQDTLLFNTSCWMKMKQAMQRPGGIFEEKVSDKWQLDQTEGRNRMRLRLIPDNSLRQHDFQPKRRQSQGPLSGRRGTLLRSKMSVKSLPRKSTQPQYPERLSGENHVNETSLKAVDSDIEHVKNLGEEDDFEMVEGPEDEPEGYEDKNRKVMRSLHRGDQVEHVQNVARIVGLEAVESLLILGKAHLYLLDSLFQRSDGEVVNAWHAPPDECDPYLQMIAGREAESRPSNPAKCDYDTRSWRWEDVLSISKRRFLFREVAIEIFFVDGRSYLLTTRKPDLRDALYQRLSSAATAFTDKIGTSTEEDVWRVESVRNHAEETQSLGSKFTSVFASAATTPATRRWMKGEISNFHYLMLVNTMAGRTFNDLSQYPVFPWVLADYESDELDLSDPRSYRDLSKPMGCQTPERKADFQDRFRSFAEMGGPHSTSAHHYGTHYSSAMTVTSYLIRLQPFVQSYLLLQGGQFDHPDRLFYSVKNSWTSASRDNMTDVRELVPEFFYLPDMFRNINAYDFGTRQGNGGAIDTVELPRWARGDPKIFVAKHREALESDHVSQHLHQWIDLIFGYKQRGENALEAVNVFHPISYHGARDLDAIEDPTERLATIGMIHNWGQTPHQVFQKAHPARDEAKHKLKRLDAVVENLTRLPFPVLETHDRIASLQYSSKHDRLQYASSFRLNIGPAYDKYMEWGFVDHGVRFYSAESKSLVGLFEHVHQSQLSCALFADSKTLITAGSDCTVSVWTVITSVKMVDLQPRTTLFGHRRAITALAVSRSFSALLSADSDGKVILWDLNRLEKVRILSTGRAVDCVRINDVTGTIMLCRGPEVSLWTLNGELMLQQDLFGEEEDEILCCAYYEGSGNEYLERNLIFTGQRRGVVNVWSFVIRRGAFVLEHVKSLHHLDQAGYNSSASITAILPMAQAVYTGDEDGRVYEWDCIQRQ